jgi:large subunit ribosomal protein L18
MSKAMSRNGMRERRHWRVRSKLTGTSTRPRLVVFRSNKFLYSQVIDDATGNTLAAASSNQKDLRSELGGSGSNLAAAALIGKTIAARAQEKGVKQVSFDRGGYKYHGRIKALADAAREAGLEF